jgi:predicted RNA-binding protein with PUA-like domain
MQYWLIKSEPDVFSIQDLAKAKRKTTHWEGVRNYQARNFLRDMKKGDRALFYHSNATPSAVAGVVEIVREAYPDPAAWDPRSDYHDPKASPDNPVWSMVDVRLVEIFPREIPLEELRSVKALADMELLRRGSRLSVQPVTAAAFRTIIDLAAKRPARRAY